MSTRRMFSKTITNSARFLKLPASTQMLYFHLGLNADDDGIVEAFPIIKMIGSSDEDFQILISRGFITPLNEDQVSLINDWCEHNSIRKDRKIDSKYKELLSCQPNVNQVTTKCQPSDNQMSAQVRLGKVSIGKDNKETNKEKIAKSKIDFALEKFEEFKNIYPQRNGDQNWERALRNWKTNINKGILPEQMLGGARRYLYYERERGKVGTEYIYAASNFLGKDKHFEKSWELINVKPINQSIKSTASKIYDELERTYTEAKSRGII